MTTFDKREEAFERKFVHEEDVRFKARARRSKLLGLWAAEKLHLSGTQAHAYADSLVSADLEAAGEDRIVRRLLRDFATAHIGVDEQSIRRTLDEMQARAADEVGKGL